MVAKSRGSSKPIELYTWPTPNGQKVHILLEELKLPYTVHAVNIGAGDQFKRDFLAVSPNNKIPAIVDPQGPRGKPYSVFESGAILVYLASKTGRMLGRTDTERFDILQWLMFQMGGVGPMLGQNHHFRVYAPEKLPYAIDRYTNEAKRLYSVVNDRLAESSYLGGKRYSIADIAVWPWFAGHERQGVSFRGLPHVQRWFNEIGERPAVKRGMAVLAESRQSLENDPKAMAILMGDQQKRRR